MPSVHTYAEYLALEASSNVKHEFLGGQIYAMAGGTPEHAALAAAAIGARLDVRELYESAGEPSA